MKILNSKNIQIVILIIIILLINVSVTFSQNNQIPIIFSYFDLNETEGVTDLGIMSLNAANRRMNEEFNKFYEKAKQSNGIYTYGVYYNINEFMVDEDFLYDCIDIIYEYYNPQNGHLYKGWYMNRFFEPFVFYIWLGNDYDISYLMCIIEL